MKQTSAASGEAPAEAILQAQAAGLRYVSDVQPGIVRKKQGAQFHYLDASGKPVRDAAVLQRIKALVIPPAWADVWICAAANGHLQATGRDTRGRKQYRYHARWRALRDEVKYDRMLAFGQALPAIRRRVKQALAEPGLSRDKVLATIVYLLEATMIRIGNEEYARTNHSFGLTTLRNRHVHIDGSAVAFHFRGKSGVEHAVQVDDKRLAAIIKRMRDLPGQDLFQYVDSEGRRHPLGSHDVNAWLREVAGEAYTAKDFRTWAGTILAANALKDAGVADSDTAAKKSMAEAIRSVAEKLGNTAAVCRKCYVHPVVFEAYVEGALQLPVRARLPVGFRGLHPHEAKVLGLLWKNLQRHPSGA